MPQMWPKERKKERERERKKERKRERTKEKERKRKKELVAVHLLLRCNIFYLVFQFFFFFFFFFAIIQSSVKRSLPQCSGCGAVEMSPTSICEDAGLIPSLAQ